jgi:hypothetical protein
MTDAFVTNTIKYLLHETHVRKSVQNTLSDIVFAVEQHAYENEKEEIQHQLQETQLKYSDEAARVQHLENANNILQAHQLEMRQKANQAKEHFIVDISQVLRESRNIYSLRERLKEMDKKLLLTSRLESELVDAKKRVRELERQNDPSKRKQRNSSIGTGSKAATDIASSVTAIKVPHNLLVNVDDAFLMTAFSFLSTRDVIYTAQASRYLFKKVDSMFSIGSALSKSDWGVLPVMYTSAPQDAISSTTSTSTTSSSAAHNNGAAQSPGSGKKEILSAGSSSGGVGSSIVGLTKQMAEELSKKLSAPELKTILSMLDNQKKLSNQLHTSQTENVKMKDKLEVSDTIRHCIIHYVMSCHPYVIQNGHVCICVCL